MGINNSDFVHCHCHSEYSQFDSLAPLKDLVHTARKMGFPALALTDHGTLSGLIKFIKECASTKDKDGNAYEYDTIKALPGCEMYLARKLHGKSLDEQPDGRAGNRHINLIAKNFIGYQNLCTLSEISWIDGFYHDPRIDFEVLEKNSEGLLCLSACLSNIVNANLLHNKYDVAKEMAGQFKDIFEDDYFLEIMYHGIPKQREIIPDIMKLGNDLDITVIATNDVHFIRKDQGESHEVLVCMSTNNCITNPKHLSFPYHEMYLKSAKEMEKIFRSIPQVLYNTQIVAERVDTDDIRRNLFGGMRLPKIEVPEKYKENTEFHSSFAYLKKIAWEGMKKKGWDKSEKHLETLKKELNDIKVAYENNDYDFATYFLIEYDIINYARENGILTGPGRGSGFASVLLHCLGICYGIDPLKNQLLWERFLGFDDLFFVKESDFGFEEEDKSLLEDEAEGLEEEEFLKE